MNENEIFVESVTCSKCGGHTFIKGTTEDGIYSCTTPKCYGVKAFCKNCKKLYDEDMFGKHGDVWECKECGAVQWKYTDMMRDREALLALVAKFDSTVDSIYKR